MFNQPNPNIRRSRRARTALLWGLVGSAALQLGLAVAIEFWLPELRDPEFGQRAARLYPRAAAVSPRPVTLVMLGSSRTTVGFNATLLEESLRTSLDRPVVVFNFGITGAGPLMMLLDLHRLLDRGIRPDLLLIEVLPPLLAGQVPQAELGRLHPTRLWRREISLVQRYGASARDLRVAWWQAWPVPWYVRRFTIVNRLAPACLPNRLRMDWVYHIDDCGWVVQAFGSPNDEQRRLAVARARQEYAFYLNSFRLGGPACQALRELLELCHDQRIRAALVLMPEGTDFRSWYSAPVWAQIESYLDGLSQEFATPIVNARDWVADEDFVDSHHLMMRGAAAFTDRLGREAVVPLVRSQLGEVVMK
jgi:hypothetical protein